MQLHTFYTNIINQKKADLIINLLPHYYKIKEISFKKSGKTGIFMVKGTGLSAQKIKSTLNDFGYKCKID